MNISKDQNSTSSTLQFTPHLSAHTDKACQIMEASLVAGLAIYLVYMTLKWFAWSAAINIWVGSMMIGLLFYAAVYMAFNSEPRLERVYPCKPGVKATSISTTGDLTE